MEDKKPYPEFLYRYRPFNSAETKEWVRQIIVDSTLYAASPITFNDPFDCKIHMDLSGNKSEVQKYLLRILKKKHPDRSPSSRLKEAARMLASENWRNISPDFMMPVVNSIGIVSLSDTYDEILMWSHYSDHHKGIVLKFCTGGHSNVIRMAYPVNYTSDYPCVRAFSDDRENIIDILITKSNHWKYEREYRIITFNKGVGPVEFRDDSLVGIIFGCDMRNEDKDLVKSMIASRRCKPILYQARRADRQFGLVVEPIG